MIDNELAENRNAEISMMSFEGLFERVNKYLENLVVDPFFCTKQTKFLSRVKYFEFESDGNRLMALMIGRVKAIQNLFELLKTLMKKSLNFSTCHVQCKNFKPVFFER